LHWIVDNFGNSLKKHAMYLGILSMFVIEQSPHILYPSYYM